MSRPLLLDLFCKAGGSAEGYHRAGFDVVGVDIEHQPNYPFDFIQGDAISYLIDEHRRYDAIHASPPCHHYSVLNQINRVEYDTGDLLPTTLTILERLEVPWVVENVPGAASQIGPHVVVCGSAFGLQVRRHRLFRTSFPSIGTVCDHKRQGMVYSVNGGAGGKSTRDHRRLSGSTQDWRDAMEIQWMTGKELTQAIPPVYTTHIGLQMRKHVTRRNL